jgi:hypothetical protein
MVVLQTVKSQGQNGIQERSQKLEPLRPWFVRAAAQVVRLVVVQFEIRVVS